MFVTGEELHAHVPLHLRGGWRAEHGHRRPEVDSACQTRYSVLHNFLISGWISGVNPTKENLVLQESKLDLNSLMIHCLTLEHKNTIV
jgi:hypothetical protein